MPRKNSCIQLKSSLKTDEIPEAYIKTVDNLYFKEQSHQ